MKLNTQTSLILLGAFGVDIFLIWLAKSKLVKIMWGCFGAFYLSLVFLMIIWDYLYNDPGFHTLLLFLAGMTAVFFITGVVLAYITVMTEAD